MIYKDILATVGNTPVIKIQNLAPEGINIYVKADVYDLEQCHQYEKSNPRAFISMYQFWCQKL